LRRNNNLESGYSLTVLKVPFNSYKKTAVAAAAADGNDNDDDWPKEHDDVVRVGRQRQVVAEVWSSEFRR